MIWSWFLLWREWKVFLESYSVVAISHKSCSFLVSWKQQCCTTIFYHPSKNLFLLLFLSWYSQGDTKIAAKGSQLATKCASLNEHTWDLDEECITAGGRVSSMEWDPHGERLAVIFQGSLTLFWTTKYDYYIPFFRPVLKIHSLQFVDCGLISKSTQTNNTKYTTLFQTKILPGVTVHVRQRGFRLYCMSVWERNCYLCFRFGKSCPRTSCSI